MMLWCIVMVYRVNTLFCFHSDDNGELHEGRILIADRTQIRMLDLDTKEYYSFVVTAKNVLALDYDYQEKIVYYTDVVNDHIARARVPEDTDVLSHDQQLNIEVTNPEGIAVDWLARLVCIICGPTSQTMLQC